MSFDNSNCKAYSGAGNPAGFGPGMNPRDVLV
jgi:hypothetical protein